MLAANACAQYMPSFAWETEASISARTADTVKKAQKKGIPVKLFQYDLT